MHLRPVEDIEKDVAEGPIRPPAILFQGEGEVLWQYAFNSPAAIVEIGSYHGGGSCLLADASRGGCGELVYVIDRHEPAGSDEDCPCEPAKDWKAWSLTVSARRGFDLIRPVGLWSQEAAPAFASTAVGFLFIDGRHSFPDVARDIHDWTPLVHPEGAVAFHDTHKPGVREAIEKWAPGEGWVLVTTAGTLAVYERP